MIRGLINFLGFDHSHMDFAALYYETVVEGKFILVLDIEIGKKGQPETSYGRWFDIL